LVLGAAVYTPDRTTDGFDQEVLKPTKHDAGVPARRALFHAPTFEEF